MPVYTVIVFDTQAFTTHMQASEYTCPAEAARCALEEVSARARTAVEDLRVVAVLAGVRSDLLCRGDLLTMEEIA